MISFNSIQANLFQQTSSLYNKITNTKYISNLNKYIQAASPIPINLNIGMINLSKVPNGPGFYIFYIKSKIINNSNSINNFITDWKIKPQFNFQHSPAIIKKRIVHYKNFSNWVPLYLGKSEHIHDRIIDHIYPNVALDLDSQLAFLRLSI